LKILIIGSKGFIGSACYTYFKGQTDYEVYGADVAVEYDDANYLLIDAINADFKAIFRKYKFDWCINCAGAASVPDSFKHPEKDYLLNVHLLVNILNAIREENISCKLIQMSSAAVYGNPKMLPINETHELGPLSPYEVHKKQAEELCSLYHQYFGVSTYIFRVFSAYGRGLKKQLFWDLFKKSQLQNDIMLFGTGKETREFIHVNDIVNAIQVIINAGKTGFSTINVANNNSVTIETAANVFLNNIGFNGNLNFNGINRTGDPLYWHADDSLLKSLGYQKKVSFEDGIHDYCKWLREKK
jgi:UDP-glucose 4-epimerase